MKQKIVFIFLILSIPYCALAQFISWQPTLGPGGGFLERLYAFDDGLIFATGSSTNIVFCSIDTGRKWSRLPEIFRQNRLAAYTKIGKIIIAEDWNGNFFKSSDRGVNWALSQSQGIPYASAISLSNKQDTLFGLLNSNGAGVFRSIDSAKNWQSVSIGLPTWVRILKDTVHNYVRVDTLLRTMFCMVATRTAILVATDTGVYRSSNGGKNWFRSIQGLSDSLVLTMSIAGDTVYAVTKSGIYKSFDAGLIWSISFLNHPTFIASNNIIVAALMVDNTFWISIDAGVNWRKQSDSISARSVTGIDLVGSTNFITTSGQGVLRSDDSGKSWYQSNYHLNNISSGTMMFHNHELFVSGLQCGIFQTKDIDKHWSQNPNTNTINRFFDGMGYLFASDDQGLYRSSDYGITWYTNSIWNGPPHELIWAIGNIGTELFTGAERGWFVSEDSGNTWTLRSTNCGSGGDCWGGIFFNDTIWDGTDCNIWMSTDNAKSWSVVQAISQSTTHPINGHSIYYVVVPFGENLWYDNGKFNLTDKIPALATYGSNMLCTRDRMLVCTYSGVFETSDLGANWVADTNGIGAIQVNDIIADDDTLYITTANGVYRGVYKNLLGVSSPTLVKNKLISFPNPLSSKTTISFSNEQREFISVSIVNVLGKECAKLFSGDVDSGDHSYQWDASNFPPGMYLCLLRENGIAKEIPMMVMR